MSLLQPSSSLNERRVKLALIVLLLGLTPISLVRSAQLALRAKGSWDFYPNWLAAIAIIQGENPYLLVNPNQPIIISEAENDALGLNGLQDETPFPLTQVTNTPVLLFFVTLYSTVSWETAKILWLLTNLVTTFLIPPLLLRAFFYQSRLNQLDSVIICLFFYNLLATKLAIEAGQTTLIVVGASAAALALAPRSKFLAGLLLGFALSKYTLAAPVVLFFLLRRNIRPVVTAVLTQVASFFVLAFISQSSVTDIISGYIQIIKDGFVSQSSERWGHTIHLANLFPPGSPYLLPALMAITLLVAFFVFRLIRLTWQRTDLSGVCVLTLISLWSLLIVYRGDYDAVLYIFFFILVWTSRFYSVLWPSQRWQSWSLTGIIVVLAFAATSLYTRSFYFFFPNAPDVTPRTMTISVLIMLVISLWFAYRTANTFSAQPIMPAQRPAISSVEK